MWYFVWGSAIGKYHKEANPPLPCQDYCTHVQISLESGIAVCCDGAGSAPLSEIGSKFVAEKLVETIKPWIENLKALPDASSWNKQAIDFLHTVYIDLQRLANENQQPVEAYATTVIFVIYTNLGILSAHIGDGRAGYLNNKDEWKPLIEPWKGEEANQTVFITSQIWSNPAAFIETNIIEEEVLAITLLSDGCETHAFETGDFDTLNNKFISKNNPYPGFYNPLLQAIKKMKDESLSDEEIKAKWLNFLENGTQKLKDEPDDKSLILGIRL